MVNNVAIVNILYFVLHNCLTINHRLSTRLHAQYPVF